MSNIIPYILPLMLGRTFDLDTMKVGVDIFPKEAIDNRKFFSLPTTNHYSGLMTSRDDKVQLMNVDNTFSLKVKSGAINAGVAGEFLKDPFYKTTTVDMVHRTFYQSGMEFLPDNATPIPTWKKYGKALGTHYVHSIIYGVEVITSFRFETNSTEMKEKIKNPITHGVYKFGGDDEFYNNLLNYVEATNIQVFSSIPISKLPYDLPSLKDLIGEIAADHSKYNEGRGMPIRMELRSLEQFDSNMTYDRFVLNLEEPEFMFDELRQVKTEVSDWLKRLSKPLTEEQEQKIGEFYNNVEDTLKVFYEVIGSLDTSQGPDQLQKLKDAYEMHIQDKEFIFHGGEYYRKFRKLRKEMEKEK